VTDASGWHWTYDTKVGPDRRYPSSIQLFLQPPANAQQPRDVLLAPKRGISLHLATADPLLLESLQPPPGVGGGVEELGHGPMMEPHGAGAGGFVAPTEREVLARTPQDLAGSVLDRGGAGSGPNRMVDDEGEHSPVSGHPSRLLEHGFLVPDVLQHEDDHDAVHGIGGEEIEWGDVGQMDLAVGGGMLQQVGGYVHPDGSPSSSGDLSHNPALPAPDVQVGVAGSRVEQPHSQR